MAQPGDTVRYLNDVGGGVITRIDGQMAYVDDNGFETPVLLKELVVVLPAGHKPDEAVRGARLMFDQKAFDAGRQPRAGKLPKEIPAQAPEPQRPEAPAPETDYGDRLNIALAFEPTDLRRLGESRFNAVLVNDSNYRLLFALSRRGADERGWTVVYQGDVAPNELIDLAQFDHRTLGGLERVSFQCVALKTDRPYTLQPPVAVSRRLDLTKFHKLHCFRPGTYFDTPVIEIPLVRDDVVVKPLEAPERVVRETPSKEAVAQLKSKYRVDAGRQPGTQKRPEANPTKLLPPVEVDLHIGELTDSTAGMSNADMLAMQLDTVRRTMAEHSRRIGQKIIFIHGKGDGVLRREVLGVLRREWPAAELQDASFREYGFGATLVTVRQEQPRRQRPGQKH